MNGAFSPIHPVLSVDPGGDQATLVRVETGDDSRRFVLQASVFSACGGQERRPLLGPVEEIGGRGNANRVRGAVPLRIGEHIGAVLALDEAGVLNAARPFAGLLAVLGGKENRLGVAGEVDAVGAFGQAEARGVGADGHGSRIVFGAVEHYHLAVADDGCGIEGVQSLPVSRRLQHRVGKDGFRPRRDDRIAGRRAHKGANGPGRNGLRLQRSGAIQDRRE
jgi:hypothetical protein